VTILRKVLGALEDLGWEDQGRAEHPHRYPRNHLVVKGNIQLDIWPAVEGPIDGQDYVGIAPHVTSKENYELLCGVTYNPNMDKLVVVPRSERQIESLTDLANLNLN